jgi:hypothetical protein
MRAKTSLLEPLNVVQQLDKRLPLAPEGEVVKVLGRLFRQSDHLGVKQDLKMVRDGGTREVRLLGNVADAHAFALGLSKHGNDELTRLVSERDKQAAARMKLAFYEGCVLHGLRAPFESNGSST